jgi:predicted GNAT superfamily acetyltransferase
MEIRATNDIRELRVVEQLQREVWGCADLDIVPAMAMRAAIEVGAICLVAWEGPEMVGFSYGFPGYPQQQPELHSDMLAVRRKYRDRGLGYQLKLAQREHALRAGYRKITWTFDPLRSRNAYFNLEKLGAVADRYLLDFYGETSSELHRTGTDRLWVTWWIASERVERCLAGHRTRPCEPVRTIEIPLEIDDVEAANPAEAMAWRTKTRAQFREAIHDGFVVTHYAPGRYALEMGRLEDWA